MFSFTKPICEIRTCRGQVRPGIMTLMLVVAAAGLATRVTQAADEAGQPSRPNLVFILADDLGYADVGSFGQQRIRTPHLDRLAAEGLRLTQHYSGNAVCAPSRCVLMTGYHPGHAYIRDNSEVKPEGQRPLPAETQTLARLLQAKGYATGAFGKWGLGSPGSSGDPLNQGFERFFGYNCQRVAHNYYPTYLWDNAEQRPLDNPAFAAHQKFPPGADPQSPAAYAGYTGKEFAPDLITDAALEFIRASHQQRRPFFVYVPSTIPHLALQIPADGLAEYEGTFPEEPYLGDKAYLPHRTPRAAYAAMVTRLDQHVGRILDLLDELKLTDSTLVVFSSDNGPLYDRLGGTDTDFFRSAADLRGRKGSLYEGGVRVPTIVRWPGQVAAGTTSDRVSGFEDWLPTMLDAAGLGDTIPTGLDGISLLPTLQGREQPPRPFLYREFPGYGGQQSIRVGDWKAVRQQLRPPQGREPKLAVELYNLANDPQESRDVAAEYPEKAAELLRRMQEQHRPSAEFPIPALDRGG